MAGHRNLAVAALTCAALSACGGGGGGSNIREVPFTSFAAVQPNERVVMQGTSQTASGSLTTSPGGGFNVDTANLNAVQAPGASLMGSATGRFYGPAAEEIGGTYGLSGSTPRERMIGAFGGKQ